MIHLLVRLLCRHDYEVIREADVHWAREDGGGFKYVRQVWKCNKCWKLKKVKL